MNPVGPDAEFWLRLLAVVAVEVAVTAVVAALVTWRLRSASWRRSVWQGAVVVMGILTMVEVWGWRASGLRERSESAESQPARKWVVSVDAAPRTPVVETEELPAMEITTPTPAVPRKPVWWPGWLWLIGTLGLGLRSVWIHGWVLRRQGWVADADTQTWVAQWSSRLGLRRVNVRIWPTLRGPAAYGIWRPTVALPQDFAERFPAAQREAMLAHELAHLAGRDPAWMTWSELTCAVLWWHPGAWWVRRKLRSASEEVADAAASLVPDGPVALAESLVTLGRELSASDPVPALGVAGPGFRSELGRRVTALLEPSLTWIPTRRRDRLRLAGWMGVALAIGWANPIPGGPENSLRGLLLSQVRAVTPGVNAPATNESPKAVPTLTPTPSVSTPSPAPAGVAKPPPVSEPVTSAEAPVATQPATAGDKGTLVTRTYRLNPTNFLAAVRATDGVVPSATGGEQVRQFFALCGLYFQGGESPDQSAAYYLSDSGRLAVRASLPFLEALGEAINLVNASYTELTGASPAGSAVRLEGHFVELTPGGEEDVGLDWFFGLSATNNPATEINPWRPQGGQVEVLRAQGEHGILSESQFLALRRRLEDRPGVKWLTLPVMTTTSGRLARVVFADARTVVTGVTANVDERTEAIGFDRVTQDRQYPPGINYHTESIPLGPGMDIVPQAEGDHWRLDLLARATELLGYDEPRDPAPSLRIHGAKPITATKPLPRFRHREVVDEVSLQTNQVVALRGPRAEWRTVEKGGLLRRVSTNVIEKRLYVFVQAKSVSSETLSDRPAPATQPVIVQVLPESGRFRLGSREVAEFELSGVLRSLRLAHPGTVLLIRHDAGVSAEAIQKVRAAAQDAGVPNVVLPLLPP
ncbi:MAG: hypothetical protein J0M24_03930 [Verrucomicrobia bacterium]|nr:hypothetical protein [Verrucomicrobiota bacterium]